MQGQSYIKELSSLSLDEPLSPIGKEVFLSLPDEEKYLHFLELFERVQDLDFEVCDSREGLHQLQVELIQYRQMGEENKKLQELVALQKEKNENLEALRAGEFTIEREELENLRRELSELGQALLVNQEEKQRLLLEKNLLEADLREQKEKFEAELQDQQVKFEEEQKGQKEILDLSPELEKAKAENQFLRQEFLKVKEMVLNGLREAKELKIKATAAINEKADLERSVLRFKGDADSLRREKGYQEEILKRLKGESQHILLKLKDELELNKKELEQAKTAVAKRVKEVTLLEDTREAERVDFLDRIKKLEDSLRTERSQRDAEIARLSGGEELLLRLSPHIEALHRMVVEKGKEEIKVHDFNSPSLFDSLSPLPFQKDQLF